MPTYDYKCKECGKVFEVFRRFSELDEKANCPNCGSTQTGGFSLFLILKVKPWQALGMGKLNLLRSLQNQVEGWGEVWAEGWGEGQEMEEAEEEDGKISEV